MEEGVVVKKGGESSNSDKRKTLSGDRKNKKQKTGATNPPNPLQTQINPCKNF